MKVVGVYNAEGTLKGEVVYLLNKIVGRGQCILCEITHGWQPFSKRIWREGLSKTTLNIEMLHTNDLSTEQRLVIDKLPVFLVEAPNGKWSVLMNDTQIADFADNPEGLLQELRKLVKN